MADFFMACERRLIFFCFAEQIFLASPPVYNCNMLYMIKLDLRVIPVLVYDIRLK